MLSQSIIPTSAPEAALQGLPFFGRSVDGALHMCFIGELPSCSPGWQHAMLGQASSPVTTRALRPILAKVTPPSFPTAKKQEGSTRR